MSLLEHAGLEYAGPDRSAETQQPQPAPAHGRGPAARTADRLIRVAAAQRVRWGLTGLAAIFLLVLVASAGMRPAASAAPVDSHAEPLAVLGVAPAPGPAAFDSQGEPRPKVPRASRT